MLHAQCAVSSISCKLRSIALRCLSFLQHYLAAVTRQRCYCCCCCSSLLVCCCAAAAAAIGHIINILWLLLWLLICTFYFAFDYFCCSPSSSSSSSSSCSLHFRLFYTHFLELNRNNYYCFVAGMAVGLLNGLQHCSFQSPQVHLTIFTDVQTYIQTFIFIFIYVYI